ncbi:hypothetical protein B0T24DRAFT_79965 [Lasiosphaeria ovina]|uniref:Uncharacterized protein n=1 Tax=Lasiosphaeria ovina TaxID=92902 RepID=A0AAE0TYQ5_9PEZI|nr:hypothetical protein B0T24DRAFT_79965 [Lasiosphaeria ovina]
MTLRLVFIPTKARARTSTHRKLACCIVSLASFSLFFFFSIAPAFGTDGYRLGAIFARGQDLTILHRLRRDLQHCARRHVRRSTVVIICSSVELYREIVEFGTLSVPGRAATAFYWPDSIVASQMESKLSQRAKTRMMEM